MEGLDLTSPTCNFLDARARLVAEAAMAQQDGDHFDSSLGLGLLARKTASRPPIEASMEATLQQIEKLGTKHDGAKLGLAFSHSALAKAARAFASVSLLGFKTELVGPVGERNLYALHPRGQILLIPQTIKGLFSQIAAALATGNQIVIDRACGLKNTMTSLPGPVLARISWSHDWLADGPFSGALVEGDTERVGSINKRIANLNGPLILVQSATSEELANDHNAYCLNWLLEEVSTSINTAAASGNASLMMIG